MAGSADASSKNSFSAWKFRIFILLGIVGLEVLQFTLPHRYFASSSMEVRTNLAPPTAQNDDRRLTTNQQQQQQPHDLNEKNESIVVHGSYQDDGSSSFSACLLMMDDNHFLIEWLAYHYHTLPLRYVVVAIDPRSKTSPKHVFDRWGDRIKIIEWRNDWFFPEEMKDKQRRAKDFTLLYKVHRERQKYFFFNCMLHMKQQNRTWTILTDTDEYLQYNQHNQLVVVDQHHDTTIDHGPNVTILHQLNQARRNFTTASDMYKGPCISIPRLKFGTRPVSSEEQQRLVPQGFRGSDFLTLRWEWHAQHNNVNNRHAKAIVDVSRVNATDFNREDTSTHRPSRPVCSVRNMYTEHKDSLFVIHHYTGTWEQFDYRDDARKGHQRSREKFKVYSELNHIRDDSIRGWLQDFVNVHGLEEALTLLKDVGYVPPKDKMSHPDRSGVNVLGQQQSLGKNALRPNQRAPHVPPVKKNLDKLQALRKNKLGRPPPN